MQASPQYDVVRGTTSAEPSLDVVELTRTSGDAPPQVPNLRTPPPMVEFHPGTDQYAALIRAAYLNEARVRETLALLASAQTALADGAPLLAAEQVRAASFAIAALLPPANIRIRMSLEELKSLSGRKKAA